MNTGATSLWEINYDDAKERIKARRDRISNRLEAAKRLTTMIKIGQVFGEGILVQDHDNLDGNLVAVQCRNSRRIIGDVVENGLELVGNIRVAADHLQSQHKIENERRNETLTRLLAAEEKEAEAQLREIDKKWPRPDAKDMVPTELYAQILKQKATCNELLEKKNDLIGLLEEETQEADQQYKVLIDDYHENISVLSSRMESQIQVLETLIVAERRKIESEYGNQRSDLRDKSKEEWRERLDELDRTSEDQMERRLRMLSDNERELDKLILEDAEAFVDMKHELEDSIRQLSDQIQFLEAIHQLNEERLDFEIHVLRKHEEEAVLVKSEQKRRITTLQDNITKLRQRVSQSHRNVAKEETVLHASVADIQQQMRKLRTLRRSHCKHAEVQRGQIVDMVRKEVEEKLEGILELDRYVMSEFVSADAAKVSLHLDPILGGQRRREEGEEREEDEGEDVSGVEDLETTTTSTETDFALRDLLANLAHKANFLVEENLQILVEADDIGEKERHLFRLDSILAAIGVEAEEEILAVLKQHKDNPERARTDSLKIIRTHVERCSRQQQGFAAAAAASSGRRRSSGISSSSSNSTGTTTEEEAKEEEESLERGWERMIDSFDQLVGPDRVKLLEQLKSLSAVNGNIGAVEAENRRLRRMLSETRDIAKKMGAR